MSRIFRKLGAMKQARKCARLGLAGAAAFVACADLSFVSIDLAFTDLVAPAAHAGGRGGRGDGGGHGHGGGGGGGGGGGHGHGHGDGGHHGDGGGGGFGGGGGWGRGNGDDGGHHGGGGLEGRRSDDWSGDFRDPWREPLKKSGDDDFGLIGALGEKQGKDEHKHGHGKRDDDGHRGKDKDRDDRTLPPRAVTQSPAGRPSPKPGAAAAVDPAHAHKAPIGSKSYSNGEVLAVNLSAAALDQARRLGFRVPPPSASASIGASITRLELPPEMEAPKALALLQRDLPGERFALNKLYRTYRIANASGKTPAERVEPVARDASGGACKADRCVARELIGWQEQLRSCSAGVRIGVVDTGIDHTHPAFANGNLRVGNFVPEGRIAAPTWHGTAVLGLLAGNSGAATPGLVPQANFFVAGAFFGDGTGEFATDTVNLLKALDWLRAFDVKLINMSFAGPRDELVQQAIAEMSARGFVFVAAAGNDGPTAEPAYPAAYKQVVAVTAVSRDLRNYPLANRGNHIDVSAPGVNIWSAVPGAKAGYYSGTSFSAPHVTAILATVQGPQRRKNDLLAALEVKDLGPPGRDPTYGRGLLLAPGQCQPNAVVANAQRSRDAPAQADGVQWPTMATSVPATRPQPATAGYR